MERETGYLWAQDSGMWGRKEPLWEPARRWATYFEGEQLGGLGAGQAAELLEYAEAVL
jgi:hypothetical protein